MTTIGKINNRKDFDAYIDTYQEFHDRLKNKGIDTHELIVEEFEVENYAEPLLPLSVTFDHSVFSHISKNQICCL